MYKRDMSQYKETAPLKSQKWLRQYAKGDQVQVIDADQLFEALYPEVFEKRLSSQRSESAHEDGCSYRLSNQEEQKKVELKEESYRDSSSFQIKRKSRGSISPASFAPKVEIQNPDMIHNF